MNKEQKILDPTILPSIVTYLNYRTFLKDFYEAKKAFPAGYSYRRFSKDLGFESSNFIHLVLQGKRQLSKKTIQTIQNCFYWNALEKKYFECLVLENQSISKKEKEKYKKEIDKLKTKKRTEIPPSYYDAYFSNWFVPPLREILNLKGFQKNISWISKKFLFKLQDTQIQEALEILKKLNMIRKNNEKWEITDEHLTTPLEVTSDMLFKYHKEMIKLSNLSLALPAEQRNISALTMGISKKQLETIKQKVDRFRDEIQQEIQESTEPIEVVAQLNIQYFPIAKS